MLGEGSTVGVLGGGTRRENSYEQDERAVSGMIHAAVALTTRKMRESLSGMRRKRFEAM
jgi:hypothetical protein